MIFFKQGSLIGCKGWALNFFKYQATTMLIWNSKIKKKIVTVIWEMAMKIYHTRKILI